MNKRHIRTLPANRFDYLLANYPADTRSEDKHAGQGDWDWCWSEEQVKRAMQAAYNAGKRDAKRKTEAK